jgi:imidazolonepropionase-like amidohydrolase
VTTRLINARLVDGNGGAPVDGATVVVEGETILAVDASAPARDDTVIDLEGRTLLPGLISAHTHHAAVSTGDELSPGEIAAWAFEHLRRSLDLGFTTCRELGGIDGGIVKAVDNGIARGPRLVVSGPLLVQMGGHADFRPAFLPDPCSHPVGVPGLWQGSYVCDGVDGVRRAARLAFKRGAKLLKMCATGGVTSLSDSLDDTQFTVEEMRAAVQEARARGTYVTIHTVNNAGVRNGLAAGVECFEHVVELDDDTAALIKAAGACVVPTLAVTDVYAGYGNWLPAEVIKRVEGVGAGMRRAIEVAHRHGILVGAGADLIGPNQTQYGLETALVAEVVGAEQAIVTTTRDNARVLRMSDRIGTVEPGKLADLVVVAGDPLADPRLLVDPANIVLVAKGGTVVKSLL